MEAWIREYLALTTYEISCPVLRDPALAPAGKTGVIVSTLMDYRLVKAIAEAGWYPAFKALCEEQMGANGLGLPARRGKNKSANPYQIGLYGPVILISQADYQAVGGHAAIRDSIVDDMALGQKLREKDIPFALFMGDHDVSYRMYRGGLRQLVQGWTKNQAAGVAKTPLLILVLVFFWITAVASAPLYLVLNLVWQQWLGAGLMAACYGIWVLELNRITRHIGSFSVISIVFYPPLLLFYLLIFLRSLAKKILGHPVIWKDRKIRLDK